MDKLNSLNIKDIFAKIKDIMAENKNWLFKLDSAMGDGDLGLTMNNGFNGIYEAISTLNEEKVGKIIMQAGVIFADTAPSTIGTLVATGFIRAGKIVKDKTEINLSDLVMMMSSFVEGIRRKGKAELGDKTIVDSLYPAYLALKSASEEKKDLGEAFKDAYQSAKQGVEDTKKMVAKHGRAAWYREKSIGKEDPGAVAGMLIVKAFYEYLKEKY